MSYNYFISAGEYSGDLLAADLVTEIRKLRPHIESFGITGPKMREVGVRTTIDNSALSVMGVADVLRQVGDLRVVEQRILQQVDINEPLFAILVDYPGFHLRLAEQLKLRGIPTIQYIAPKAWAWGGKRVVKMKRDLDLVLGMLPFEESFFKDAGVNYKYIGSPILDRIDDFLASHSPQPLLSKLVAFLPGSRESEIRHMLPIFIDSIIALQTRRSDLQFAISVAGNIGTERMKELLAQTGKQLPKETSFVEGDSFALMRSASACVVTSGTATLECALLNTPQLIAYKTQKVTYAIAKKVMKIKYVGLPNLLMNSEIVKEFIQNVDSAMIVEELGRILDSTSYREKMLAEYSVMRAKLQPQAAANAARIVCEAYLP